MFKVSVLIIFNMIKLIISCLNVSHKKLIVWLQLHPKLIASDYITTGRPLGRTKSVHSCVTPQGAWGESSEAWLANSSSLTYFNTNGRVSGLGKTSWYAVSDISILIEKIYELHIRLIVQCMQFFPLNLYNGRSFLQPACVSIHVAGISDVWYFVAAVVSVLVVGVSVLLILVWR